MPKPPVQSPMLVTEPLIFQHAVFLVQPVVELTAIPVALVQDAPQPLTTNYPVYPTNATRETRHFDTDFAKFLTLPLEAQLDNDFANLLP